MSSLRKEGAVFSRQPNVVDAGGKRPFQIYPHIRLRARIREIFQTRFEYSYGATGEGRLASFILSIFERPSPIILSGEVRERLHTLAANASRQYIFELFAAVARIYQLRDGLWGGKVALFADNVAATAASTTGAA